MTAAASSIIRRLIVAGMSPAAAGRKAALLATASAKLCGKPTTAWFVPGRIEFLGKHTDYAGGRSLLCAVEQGFCIVARPAVSAVVRITSADTGEYRQFPLDADLVPAAGHWSNYPMTVARRIAANFPGPLVGADIVFASDLPPAAGLSSSSAMIIATFMALSDVNRLAERAEYRESIQSIEDLCGYLGTIENGQTFGGLGGSRGVGTFGGSQDHTAILCAEAGRLVQYSFSPVRREATVPLPAGHEFVIAASGVVAEKTGAAKEKYNRVAQSVTALLEHYPADLYSGPATLAQAVRSGTEALKRFRRDIARRPVDQFNSAQLLARLDQFIEESERIIPAAADALRQGDLEAVARLVDESQANADVGLANQTPETIFLAAVARRRGAIAASAFGAGFGGSVWALVPANAAASFLQHWATDYAVAFPDVALAARFFRSAPGTAATRIIGPDLTG